MKILGLYNNECAVPLFEWLKNEGHEVIMYTGKLDAEWCRHGMFDLAVSYTYRFIIKEDVIEALNNNVVNIHNSFLPFNRGADPNIWSMIDGTPRGVTLHYINAGLDKGDIISQKIVLAKKDDTFSSSYEALDKAAQELFKESFVFYRYWNEMKKKAIGTGSYHSSNDAKQIKDTITSYDMRVSEYTDKCIRGVQNKLNL